MLPFGGWGVGAANQGRESLEGRRLSAKENEISIDSVMAGNVPF